MITKRYCPNCASKRPLCKAGFNCLVKGKRSQRWLCRNCFKITLHPKGEV